ncbi:hypothetical protein ACFY1J_05135 [Streptomyces sp. NPDC001406]|uniref:hypothetical protein n=1 Tax=Streptomyces sp. NPDC001406 TaxID=3364572 RepID=UPI0036CCF522
MAGTTARTRKTAAPKTAEDTPTEETTAAAPEETALAAEDTPAADSTPKAPDAAPLEPPAVEMPPEAPAAPVYASPTEVIPDDANLADVITDDATKQPPADPSTVFQPLTPYGSALVCTVRLVEKTFIGPHSNPVERLLQPAGAHVSESVAARIQERLDAQAARFAAQAAADSDEK